MTADELRTQVRTFRYSDAVYVIVDSLPQPYQNDFWRFLFGSARPVGDGRNRYAYAADFERWIAASFNRSL